MIKACLVKESYPACAQIGLTWIVEAYIETIKNNAIPDYDVIKEGLLNGQVAVRVIDFTI